ncbi:hypothetical protein K32_25440 [Kaistia sp. 32K]|uniref:hypothetical protein n=1 Tax=Kaistia sp. 32K TaxID=2795690 RepID=UPI001916A92B|nr:hypothetical protein [Kaistia sp. 32K]BCP53927.1 hypothetical protein K32_25440 [Kaistia sp. 32K]
MAYLEKAPAFGMAHPAARSRSALVGAGVAILSLLIFAMVALRVLNFEMRKDEQLYVPPIRLLETEQIYRDFFYNHTPGSAWLFYGIGRLTGSDHLLLTGRLGVLLGWVVLISAIAAFSYVLTRSRLVSWCIVLLSLMNENFLLQPGMTATNNLLPLPLSFIGVALFVLGVRDERPQPLYYAASGFFLALAVCFKVSAVAFVFPIAIAAFLLPRALGVRERAGWVVAPLAIGGVVGGLPILYYLATDGSRFLAHVLGYHTGPHVQYMRLSGSADDGAAMSLVAKLLLAHDIWFSAGIAVALVVVLTLLITVLRRRAEGRPAMRAISAPALVVLGALVFSVAFSFIPTPGFPQYFAPPLICLPLALALAFGDLGVDERRHVLPVLIAATAIVLLIATPRLGQFLGRAPHPGRWTVMQVHDDGVRIAERMAEAGAHGKVATLAPLYPLEGGLQVYPELATGPFAYRSGDLTKPALAAQYKMTSPTRVGALLASDPPAALLLGFDPVLEAPMRAFAEANGYAPVSNLGVRDRYGTAMLYLRPAQPPAP